jgi:hypothetical protein
VVTPPGETVRLQAKLEQRNILLKDIEDAIISFRLISSPKGTKLDWSERMRTNGDGRAETTFSIAEEGLYEIEVDYEGTSRFQPKSDRIVVLAISRDKPVLVLDVDKTLTQENWTKRDIELPPYDENTVAVVNELAKRYAVVYLSARPKVLHRTTRNWLRRYKFPEGPILLWHPDKFKWLSFEKYKEDILLNLRKAGIKLAVGVGNAEGDIEAYLEAGMKAVWLSHRAEKKKADTEELTTVSSWSQIQDVLLGNKEHPASQPAKE